MEKFSSVKGGFNTLRKLEDVFGKPTRLSYGEERDCDPTSPFDKFAFDHPSPDSVNSRKTMPAGMVGSIKDRVQCWGDIPVGFEAPIFDAAEARVKYLVLTNIWPKFIKEHSISLGSIDTMKPGIEV